MKVSTKRTVPGKTGKPRNSGSGLRGKSVKGRGRFISLFNYYYSLMLERKIHEFHFQEGDLKIYIRRARAAGGDKSDSAVPREKTSNKKFISSPLTGIFYVSSNPNSPAYVTPPCDVKKGDILCVIEAMKVMNEIESMNDCRLLATVAKNAELVTQNAPLFEIE